ncbi:DNA polymerase II [Shewanella submarina]|uniref:DNA polymerase n=1 Tax=Shewanella submarina TaxID=2016376 RepID=A0ABV7G9C0_9GAMM|nr:DNA polymerase II [Shewanella submarina]MCL1036675.1 DNA polymerase II [Shewanella submarina]
MTQTSSQLIQARVLTRHRVRVNDGYCLRYMVKTPSGPAVLDVAEGDFICFCHQQDLPRLQTMGARFHHSRMLELKSFESQPVAAVYLSDYRAVSELTRMATDAGIPLFESDIRPQTRFLTERYINLDLKGEVTELGQLGSLKHYQLHRAKAGLLDLPLRAVSFDLECSMSGELYSAGFYSDEKSCVLMVGDGPETRTVINEAGEELDCELICFADEKSLLEGIVDWFTEYDPDLIIGWAVVTFDLALLHRRAQIYGMTLLLGRAQTPLAWKVADKFRPETLELPGRVVLDGIDWLKAAFYQFDSYSLEFVSRELLGEGKAIDKVDDRGGEIGRLFAENKSALAFYNLTDCRLVWDIFEHTQLFDFALARSRMTGLELGRVGASVAAFNHLYLPHLHRAGYVAPQMSDFGGLESPGGYVMDSLPGLYKDVLVLDFKSLYPSIIRTFLIDPKGLVQGLLEPEEDSVPGFLGARFSRHNPILPGLIAELAQMREQAKSDSNAPLSQAIKIIMNSLYGVLGSKGCVFHDARLASSITMRGHEIMKQTKVWIEEEGYRVIYGDTDSTFVWLEQGASDADKLGKQLVERINNRWAERLNQEFGLVSWLELEFECHYQQFFMPTLKGSDQGSKKRYVGIKTTDKGQELIFKGMEQVRSDWTPLAKQVQLELYRRLFAGEPLDEYLLLVSEKLTAGQLDEQLVFSKRLKRNVADYTAKSAPHVKAAQILAEQTGDSRHAKRGSRIKYVMTTKGAQPVECQTAPLDYDYYLQRQIRSVAEPVLQVMKLNYDKVVSSQLMLI